MLKGKQIAVIGLVVVLMVLLLSLNIKSLTKGDSQHTGGTAANEASSGSSSLSIEKVSETAKQTLDASLVQQITDLENSLKSATGSRKVELQKELAQKWDDVNEPVPGSLYLEAVAESEPGFSNWIKAGDMLTSAYQNTQDTLVQPVLVQKAANAYQKALDQQPKSLDARTGLGMALVNGSGSPMQGIQLLLGVVKEDPENIKANLNLGLFSMRSGQFEKAVDRFKTVLAQNQNDPETWFYLASSYENLGMKSEAITAYEKSKELAGNPDLSKFVDQKVKELNK